MGSFWFITAVLCLVNQFYGVRSNCEWKMEYTGMSTQFKYYSTCNRNEYITITMSTLIEYTQYLPPIWSPSPNIIQFALDITNWDWIFGSLGIDSVYQGYECIQNKFDAPLGTLSIFGNDCSFNLTTYVFQELADINIYNLTRGVIEKYALKWDVDLDQWPWFAPNDYLELCFIVQTNIDRPEINSTEGEFYFNISVDADFYISIPKVMTCGGVINSNVEILVKDELESLIYVCIKIPYCDNHIYYDPIIYSGYQHSDSSNSLTSGQISGIVIASLVAVGCIIALYYFCMKRNQNFKTYENL
eukprot:150851_1